MGLNIVKHVFWRSPGWNPAVGARTLWGLGKTPFWHLKVMFYDGFRYFCERSVGAGP